MWFSENERTGLRKISPSSYYLRTFCETFYLVCILVTLAAPLIARNSSSWLIGLAQALALSSACFVVNALLSEFANLLLLRSRLVYDYKSDAYVPTSEQFSLRAAVGHVLCAAVWFIPIMLRDSWQIGRFTRILTLEGRDSRGSVRVYLQQKGVAHLQFAFFLPKCTAGMVGRGCGLTWTASPDMAQIEIKVSESETISLSRLPSENRYAITTENLSEGTTIPPYCAIVKK